MLALRHCIYDTIKPVYVIEKPNSTRVRLGNDELSYVDEFTYQESGSGMMSIPM